MADAVQDTTHGGDHHGDHPPHLAHHFETSAQQFDASKFGMWLFLVTEVLFFSGLFCAYAVYRRNHPEIFELGQHFLDVKWGALNTAVLIASSFTMALGVWCAQKSYQKGLVVCLALTLLGAAGFMSIKFIEYKDKIEHGKVWGNAFHPVLHEEGHDAAGGHEAGEGGEAAHGGDEPAAASSPASTAPAENASTTAASTPAAAPAVNGGLVIEASKIGPAAIGPRGLADEQELVRGHEDTTKLVYAEANRMKDAQIFIAIYYCLTGLHGIHVLAGMVLITALLIGAIKGKYNNVYYTPVDLVGLYWHVVDLIWIFLFPLLYLIK